MTSNLTPTQNAVRAVVQYGKKITSMKDVLDFVEAVAQATANTDQHKAFNDIPVSIFENTLVYHDMANQVPNANNGDTSND